MVKALKFEQSEKYTVLDKVDYGSQCRGLCSSSPQIQLAMQEILWKEWALRFNSPNKINQDVLMVYEVYDDGINVRDPLHVGFALLVSCSCRSGRHPARQDFLRRDLVSQPNASDDYRGCILRARRLPYVTPHSSMPLQFVKFFADARGELDFLTEDCGQLAIPSAQCAQWLC